MPAFSINLLQVIYKLIIIDKCEIISVPIIAVFHVLTLLAFIEFPEALYANLYSIDLVNSSVVSYFVFAPPARKCISLFSVLVAELTHFFVIDCVCYLSRIQSSGAKIATTTAFECRPWFTWSWCFKEFVVCCWLTGWGFFLPGRLILTILIKPSTWLERSFRWESCSKEIVFLFSVVYSVENAIWVHEIMGSSISASSEVWWGAKRLPELRLRLCTLIKLLKERRFRSPAVSQCFIRVLFPAWIGSNFVGFLLVNVAFISLRRPQILCSWKIFLSFFGILFFSLFFFHLPYSLSFSF